MRRRKTAALALTLLVGAAGLASVASPASSPPAATAAGAYNPSAEECEVLDRINAFRRKNKKPSVSFDASLGRAAERRSEDMAKRDYFSHRGWEKAIRGAGYRGNPISENIAAATNGKSARVAMKLWVKSKPHRKNMLNGNFRAIGVGQAFEKNSKYDYYWTTTFGGQVEDEVRC